MATLQSLGRFSRQSAVNGKAVTGVLAGLVLATAVVSHAVNADESKPRVTEYGDWRAVCNTQCVIAQGLQNPDNPAIIYSSQIAYVDGKAEPVMQLNLPLGIYLPPGVAIEIGEQQHRAPIAVCLPEGCKVLLVLTPDIVQKMANSAAISVKLFVSEQSPRQLKFSLRGFTEALASLPAAEDSQ